MERPFQEVRVIDVRRFVPTWLYTCAKAEPPVPASSSSKINIEQPAFPRLFDIWGNNLRYIRAGDVCRNDESSGSLNDLGSIRRTHYFAAIERLSFPPSTADAEFEEESLNARAASWSRHLHPEVLQPTSSFRTFISSSALTFCPHNVCKGFTDTYAGHACGLIKPFIGCSPIERQRLSRQNGFDL